MGRLFWKFFISILLAQLAATIGIGTVFWLRDQSRMQSMARYAAAPAIDTSRQAEFLIDSAAATLKHGGTAALRELVADSTRYSLFVIDDDTGQEMLGRRVTPEMRAQAAALLADNARRHVVRMLTSTDGKRYRVFLRWLGERGPNGMGGPRGPGPGPGLDRPPAPANAQFAHGGPGGPGGPGGHGPFGGRGPGNPPFERHSVPYITMAVGTVASFLFAALLAWYFSRPIRALRDAFEAASGGDLAPRFAKHAGVRGDELTDLGRDFDRMSMQLRTLMDGQRRLLHDVSHELRSPLARLQAAVGLAHQQPERIAASLERIERECVRMDKLVGELLTLSRLEGAPDLPAREEISVMDLVEEIVSDASFEAEQTGRHIVVSGMAVVTVRGAPDLLWRAIENVVRNAIKHSPPGGTVKLELSADAQHVHITVLDRGPGVAPADLAAIFAPFFRSEPAANNVDGHGLGLAIAQRVVLAHGGTISAHNREEGGLCVTIALPVHLQSGRGSVQ
jgi:signal transduction histidine kinase